MKDLTIPNNINNLKKYIKCKKHNPLKWLIWSQTTVMAEAAMNKQRRAEKTASTEPLHNAQRFLIVSPKAVKLCHFHSKIQTKRLFFTLNRACVRMCVWPGPAEGLFIHFRNVKTQDATQRSRRYGCCFMAAFQTQEKRTGCKYT